MFMHWKHDVTNCSEFTGISPKFMILIFCNILLMVSVFVVHFVNFQFVLVNERYHPINCNCTINLIICLLMSIDSML